jgi:hypothetical protein
MAAASGDAPHTVTLQVDIVALPADAGAGDDARATTARFHLVDVVRSGGGEIVEGPAWVRVAPPAPGPGDPAARAGAGASGAGKSGGGGAKAAAGAPPTVPALLRHRTVVDNTTADAALLSRLVADHTLHVFVGRQPREEGAVAAAGASMRKRPAISAAGGTGAKAPLPTCAALPAAAVVAAPVVVPEPYAAWLPLDCSPLLANASAVTATYGDVAAAAAALLQLASRAPAPVPAPAPAAGPNDACDDGVAAAAEQPRVAGVAQLEGALQLPPGALSGGGAGAGTCSCLHATPPPGLAFLHVSVRVTAARRPVLPVPASAPAPAAAEPKKKGPAAPTGGKVAVAATASATAPVEPPVLVSPPLLRRLCPLRLTVRSAAGLPLRPAHYTAGAAGLRQPFAVLRTPAALTVGSVEVSGGGGATITSSAPVSDGGGCRWDHVTVVCLGAVAADSCGSRGGSGDAHDCDPPPAAPPPVHPAVALQEALGTCALTLEVHDRDPAGVSSCSSAPWPLLPDERARHYTALAASGGDDAQAAADRTYAPEAAAYTAGARVRGNHAAATFRLEQLLLRLAEARAGSDGATAVEAGCVSYELTSQLVPVAPRAAATPDAFPAVERERLALLRAPLDYRAALLKLRAELVDPSLLLLPGGGGRGGGAAVAPAAAPFARAVLVLPPGADAQLRTVRDAVAAVNAVARAPAPAGVAADAEAAAAAAASQRDALAAEDVVTGVQLVEPGEGPLPLTRWCGGRTLVLLEGLPHGGLGRVLASVATTTTSTGTTASGSSSSSVPSQPPAVLACQTTRFTHRQWGAAGPGLRMVTLATALNAALAPAAVVSASQSTAPAATAALQRLHDLLAAPSVAVAHRLALFPSAADIDLIAAHFGRETAEHVGSAGGDGSAPSPPAAAAPSQAPSPLPQPTSRRRRARSAGSCTIRDEQRNAAYEMLLTARSSPAGGPGTASTTVSVRRYTLKSSAAAAARHVYHGHHRHASTGGSSGDGDGASFVLVVDAATGRELPRPPALAGARDIASLVAAAAAADPTATYSFAPEYASRTLGDGAVGGHGAAALTRRDGDRSRWRTPRGFTCYMAHPPTSSLPPCPPLSRGEPGEPPTLSATATKDPALAAREAGFTTTTGSCSSSGLFGGVERGTNRRLPDGLAFRSVHAAVSSAVEEGDARRRRSDDSAAWRAKLVVADPVLHVTTAPYRQAPAAVSLLVAAQGVVTEPPTADGGGAALAGVRFAGTLRGGDDSGGATAADAGAAGFAATAAPLTGDAPWAPPDERTRDRAVYRPARPEALRPGAPARSN